MRITKDTPADSQVETLNAHHMGEWLDSIADTSSGMIAQTLRDALSPATLDRPSRTLRSERGLWSGEPSIRRVISGPAALVSVCAWCFPGYSAPNVTHGICEPHKAAMMAEVHAYAAKQHAA